MEIKIGGVPEHFNYPWRLAIEEGVFEDSDLDINLIDYPGGTGAMTQALLSSEIDMALLLTEGAVKFISENPSYKILKVYVDSPLIWGVHSNKKRSKSNVDKLPFAISRLGSGSHLMAYVYAKNKGWDLEKIQFEQIQNLEGLRDSYKNGLDALFLWEKFTTHPFVEKGEMDRIDTCPTPWPCFVLVAHQDFISENSDEIELVLDGINMCLDSFKDRPEIAEEIAKEYELRLEQVEQWLSETIWNSTNELSIAMLQKVINTLFELKLIESKIQAETIISILSETVK